MEVVGDCDGVRCEEVMEEEVGRWVTEEGGGVGSTEERGGRRGEEEREERSERDADAREEEGSCCRCVTSSERGTLVI